MLFFASCRDIVGRREVETDISSGMTVGHLKEHLIEMYPGLEGLKNVLSIAVNAEYTEDATVLNDGDEVAFIPPVSGGRSV